MSTTIASLEVAVQTLAARDTDRAYERNGVGYNKADSWIGHALAEIPADTWGDETTYAAWAMLRKYRGQLAGAGIDFDAIPVPAEPEYGEDAARDTARTAAYRWRVEKRRAERRAANVPTIEMDAGGFGVRFPYDEELVAAIREVPDRRWDRDRTVWVVAPKGAAALAAWAEQYGAQMSAEVESALAGLAEWAAAEAAKPAKRLEMSGDTILVYFPYDSSIVTIMRSLNGRWDKAASVWKVAGRQAAKLIDMAREHDFDIAPEILAAVEALETRRAAKVDASRALDADLDIPGIRDGMKLHPFQRAGIRYLLEHADGRGIIGDEMGLGKTPQTMCTVEHADAFPCLVVVPNLVKLNWLREIDLWLPGRSITLLDSSKTAEVKTVSFRRHLLAGGGRRTIRTNDPTAEFMVVNYDILHKLLPRFSGKSLGAVIFDEAHYLKNPKALRTKAANAIASIAKLRLMATGTAILNRPIELLSPLEILGRAGEFGGRSSYQRRYCNAHEDSRGHWDVSGASNLPELNERLREVCYVRRDKRDVLTELPPVQRQTVLLPITNRKEYERAEDDVVQWARDKARTDRAFHATLGGLTAAERTEAIRAHAAEAGTRAMAAEALRRMGALRKLTGEGKVAAVKDWVTEFLTEEDKLILFTWHVEGVQEALIDTFPGCARVLASDSKERRDAEVERFQTDPDCKLIVISLNVGGVGLTITAAHHLAFVELPWRPGDVDQAEGRAYGRLNDAHGLTSYFLLGEDTFDLDMADLLDEKRMVTDAVNSGADGASGDSIMASLVAKMAERAA
jgi:SWI/SNF-related matrix-associated actin-dependent regulator 1 of chromatin subfamily A